jgi:hypothetical protein
MAVALDETTTQAHRNFPGRTPEGIQCLALAGVNQRFAVRRGLRFLRGELPGIPATRTIASFGAISRSTRV